ncbi:MAG: NADH-quinone oxidoreductase subunit J [Steroidobacteraceae bacterium]
MPLVLYWLFAIALGLAALGVILTKNPVHAALCLVSCFFTSAALWLLIEAEFLAIVLVLVYVGAVMVLFLFVVMMLDIKGDELRKGFTRYAWLGFLTAGVVIAEIVGVVVVKKLGIDVTQAPKPLAADFSNTSELGSVMYTKYVYPFELAAVLLLVAIVAAIVLTTRARRNLKVQDINMQVAARSVDRVKLISMKAEKRE